MDGCSVDPKETIREDACLSCAPLAKQEVDEIGSSSGSDHSTQCGYFKWRPHCLQSFNTPFFLVLFISLYSLTLGFIVNGLNNVNVSTIERRFDLPSSNVGFIASAYDVSAAILAVAVGYFGSGQSKARMVAIGVFVSAMGSLVMTLPHFITDTYTLGKAERTLCSIWPDVNSTCTNEKMSLGNYLYIFLAGQLLHGIGGTTMFTVGVSLIDDSVKPNKTPMYLGFVYGCNILGSGLGYIVGGQLLTIYVDFDTVGNDVDLTPTDTRWLGAWWLGPLVAAAVQLCVSIPLSCFGSELPSSKNIRRERVNVAHATSANNIQSTKLAVIGLTLTLLRNPCFVFIMLGMVMEGMFLSGIAAFLPKFVENEFGLAASKAALASGIAVMPAAAGGLILGGYLAKRFKLTIRQTIKMLIVLESLTTVGSALVWIRCDKPHIYGVTKPYSEESSLRLPVSLASQCNNLCNCDTNIFEPICAEGTDMYFSPCHAGCVKEVPGKDEYTQCACLGLLEPPLNNTNNVLFPDGCRKPCNLLYLFLAVLFITMCFSFMPIAPGDSIQLRCVQEEHKTYAQGVKTLVVRMLGSFMGPIIMGKLLDLSCRTWREQCGQRLSCWLYDHDLLVMYIFFFVVTCKGLAVIFCCLALKFYRPPKKLNSVIIIQPQADNKEEEIGEEEECSVLSH